MRRYCTILIVLLTTLVGLSCGALGPTEEAAPAIEEEIIRLVNEERESLGLEPLAVNEQLMWMAQVRSDDMVENDYYDHTPPPGHPTLRDLTEQLGYPPLQAPKEILSYIKAPNAKLTGVAQPVVNGWHNSEPHWRWVTGEMLTMTGVGVAVGDDDLVIVTQLFWESETSPFTPDSSCKFNR